MYICSGSFSVLFLPFCFSSCGVSKFCNDDLWPHLQVTGWTVFHEEVLCFRNSFSTTSVEEVHCFWCGSNSGGSISKKSDSHNQWTIVFAFILHSVHIYQKNVGSYQSYTLKKRLSYHFSITSNTFTETTWCTSSFVLCKWTNIFRVMWGFQ